MMKTAKAAAESNVETPVAHFEITRVVRELRPIGFDRHGMYTIGQRLDEMLHDAMMDNATEIQDITLHFEPEQWERMKRAFHESHQTMPTTVIGTL